MLNIGEMFSDMMKRLAGYKKELTPFVVTKQSLPYLHFKTSRLLDFYIPKADCVADFSSAYGPGLEKSRDLREAIDFALTVFLEENELIMQRTVIIVCGDMWGARFTVTDNHNPTNLVLTLPDYKEFRCIPASFSIWSTIRSYKLSSTTRLTARS